MQSRSTPLSSLFPSFFLSSYSSPPKYRSFLLRGNKRDELETFTRCAELFQFASGIFRKSDPYCQKIRRIRNFSRILPSVRDTMPPCSNCCDNKFMCLRPGVMPTHCSEACCSVLQNNRLLVSARSPQICFHSRHDIHPAGNFLVQSQSISAGNPRYSRLNVRKTLQ